MMTYVYARDGRGATFFASSLARRDKGSGIGIPRAWCLASTALPEEYNAPGAPARTPHMTYAWRPRRHRRTRHACDQTLRGWNLRERELRCRASLPATCPQGDSSGLSQPTPPVTGHDGPPHPLVSSSRRIATHSSPGHGPARRDAPAPGV